MKYFYLGNFAFKTLPYDIVRKKYPPTEEFESAFPGSHVCFNETALMPF
jgi:hypothetical protein